MDIPGGIYKYELSDNSCTNTAISLPDTVNNYDYYYTKSNGVIKYVKTIDCKNLNYLYLVNKECKSSCDDSLYKMNVDKVISSPSTTAQFTVCFPQASDCLTERISSDPIYYNRNLKKCWNAIANIPTNYYIKEEDTNNRYELVDECDNYYYEQSTYKYCISDCN